MDNWLIFQYQRMLRWRDGEVKGPPGDGIPG
jgi:hypothetical protein